MIARKKTPEEFQFGGVLNAFVSHTEQKSEDINLLPLANIILPKSQPRRYFDIQKLEKLKASIEQYGILEPLIVRPVEGNIYELVAGERRYRAAKDLKLLEVPVVVRELNDKEAIQIALIENLQREDLNPVEETQGILNLLAVELDITPEQVKSLLTQMKHAADKSGHNVMPKEITVVEQVLASLGKMTWESYVKNRLPLLNLPKELLQALEQGSIEYTKAKVIARMKNEKQRKSLLKAAIAQDLSLTQIQEKIAKLKAAEVQGDEGRTDKKATYPQRLKEIYTKAKKVKSWDDPEKQQEFEALLEKLEKLL
ncbi:MULTISPECIES: ParB/RepB/Spo0J family partition protein [unclassified Tolypothrix]|uniref:ParB/RepB/Spo0J family partition protein n=1 Tax=unclassified Tolypothrix TaxID=2649714 RepID=UPI0005EAB897|nr:MULTISPECIES: ParB/RepB/Spo0J family partition protein [unclassified Tolypothrix]BAY95756.1 chromosome partitioning protein, ParB family [Microchaete diplosiphon NIES-3275]EKE97339.1 partitioning protein ParB [Tolypothrix sp. PCC 7601]MBE9086193.1 ParB/RepB/Spo0J family partition protein [Tolypothrix sp. LEGE 11397]UYD30717.1 ParB/RepB/Spo0J family partition protein [Tolypothrix sp. PCC 7712]UYD38652.1 ParB/RepB/Spo0J family partition protein [Tolypothrix sp. PCC 7601]